MFSFSYFFFVLHIDFIATDKEENYEILKNGG